MDKGLREIHVDSITSEQVKKLIEVNILWIVLLYLTHIIFSNDGHVYTTL